MKFFYSLLPTLLLLMLLAIFDAHANPNAGLQLGLNIANANTDPAQSTDPRIGLLAGANLEFQLASFFFVQPEIMYAQKGASNSISDADSTRKIDYLEFPILLKAKFGEAEVRPFLIAGPNLGFRVNSEVTNKLRGQPSQTFSTNDTESIDFCFDFGGGFEYWYSDQSAVVLTARYSLGMTNVITTALQTWRSNGVQLLAGIQFAL